MAKRERFQEVQLELFIANASDVRAKEVQELMARSWFSISKSPRYEAIEHRVGDNSVVIESTSNKPIATIWDNDLLIFLISQLVDGVNKGQIDPTSHKQKRQIKFTGYEYFKFYQKRWRRGAVGQRTYQRLWDALERLHHTHITTDIRSPGGTGKMSKFYWLPFIEKTYDTDTQRQIGYEVEFPGWLYDQVMDQADSGNLVNVVSLDPNYFEITGGLERWLYLWCHKSYNPSIGSWEESFRSLHKKSGSSNTFSQFSRYLRGIIKRDTMLGYNLIETIVRGGPGLLVTRREGHDLLMSPNELKESVSDT